MSEHTPASPETPADSHEKRDFIRQIVREDLASGKHQAIKTRFPPEPNGYLHIGHAKSICLNFGIAGEFSGVCNLRFDDTNPAKEDPEYVAAIQDDVRWLGFEWNELRHASDYFQTYYLAAEKLIEQGKAYVCDLSAEEVRAYRGTLTEPGRPSPWRDRSVEENLDLFRRMRAGEFPDGARTLRAKIDMASGNINLRDPALYRIKHVEHQNTGNAWPIYPMYDFAHGRFDRGHHPLAVHAGIRRPPPAVRLVRGQRRFRPRRRADPAAGRRRPAARSGQATPDRILAPEHQLHGDEQAQADGAGHRTAGGRLGRPAHADPAGPAPPWLHPAAMRLFAERVGISKQNSLIDFSVLEGALREDLDSAAPRRMAVVDPVKLVLTNLPEGHEEQLTFSNHPKDERFGSREVPFAREVWIDREDFAEVPPKGWKRLVPGGEVRLRGAGIIRCDEVIKDADGTITELRGWLDPESRPGMEGANRKVKGTIHWVSAVHGVPAEIRLYDRLFSVPNPDDESEGKTYRDYLNPESRRTVTGYVEPAAASAAPEQSFQFERTGYFVADRRDHTEAKPVFNRSVTLRDTWSA